MRISDWSSDVCSSDLLTQDDRREHERALLKIYADALEVPIATCPSPDALWLHYRASAAYGLAIWLSTLGTDGSQSRAISLALAQRYAAAFVELDTVSALAQPGVWAAAPERQSEV